MEYLLVKGNWGLLAAVILAVVVVLVILGRLIGGSRHGQLRRSLAELQDRQRDLNRATNAALKAENKVDRLRNRLASVKPRHAQEAKDNLMDARSLQKIANDKVLVAQNHVRRVIHEEYPPNKQARLRARYLPDDRPDDKPFSF